MLVPAQVVNPGHMNLKEGIYAVQDSRKYLLVLVPELSTIYNLYKLLSIIVQI